MAQFEEHTTFHRRTTDEYSSFYVLVPTVKEHTISDQEQILHAYRNRIQHYEERMPNGKGWEYYKKIVNPYELIYTQKRYNIFPESICALHPLSRSYFKMIEILHQTRFFETMGPVIKTAHVCEGPGGFIEAVFDEAAKNHCAVSASIAMTLRSKHSTVPGWKRAAQFLRQNRAIKIIYGEDHTGNIMRPENQQFFIDYATREQFGGKVQLFTADGGFDFSSDYLKQEPMVFPLLLSSTKIGLESLAIGGTFVLKLFDFYYKETKDLLFFLSCHFQEWSLYKPATSRPCNAEHYFIGKGFTGCTDRTLDAMRLWCSMMDAKQSVHALYAMPEHPAEFNAILTQLQTKAFHSQIEYLGRVFQMIEQQDHSMIYATLLHNYEMSYQWCVRYRVPIQATSICPILPDKESNAVVEVITLLQPTEMTAPITPINEVLTWITPNDADSDHGLAPSIEESHSGLRVSCQ